MNIQLTISMLVSDRMETLGKCLASLKPFLREMDSELIVVFTGKNQETLDLVRQYTSHIIPFDWCDDFSKARNAGLREAKGEWFLYLDDDEWFDDTGEIIRFFKSGEYRQYGSALYRQRNYMDFEGKRFSDGDVGRMCRLTPETKFIFPVHENLVPFQEPCKRMTAFVHHFGYARKNWNRRRQKPAGISRFFWKCMRKTRILPSAACRLPRNTGVCLNLNRQWNTAGKGLPWQEKKNESITMSYGCRQTCRF